MAKLVCQVCGAERPVPGTSGLKPYHGVYGGVHGDTVWIINEAMPGPDPKVLYCMCGNPDHNQPMPQHCGEYMKYVAE
jgi:hypothetical protein